MNEIEEKYRNLLRENFIIDAGNSFNAKNNLQENQFGYLSSHFVVSLNNGRRELPEWKEYADYKAEIQVRTVLQHAWAAISHELEYKKTYEIPNVLKRKLFRLAWLIELADEEFQVAKKDHKEVEIAISQKKTIKEIRVFDEINLDTINNYFLNISREVKIINENGLKAGFKIKNSDDLYEMIYDVRPDFLSDIVNLCQIKGIKSISEFNELMSFISKESFTKLSELYNRNNTEWEVSIEFIVLILILLTLNKEQIEKYDKKYWSEPIWEIIVEMAKNNNLLR